jgi:hypothetical protein
VVHGALQEVAPCVAPELDDNVGILADAPCYLLDGPDERDSLGGPHILQADLYQLPRLILDPLEGVICIGAHLRGVEREVSPGRQFTGILNSGTTEWAVEHHMAWRLAYYIIGTPTQVPARLVTFPFYMVDRRVQTPGLGHRLPLYHDAQPGI